MKDKKGKVLRLSKDTHYEGLNRYTLLIQILKSIDSITFQKQPYLDVSPIEKRSETVPNFITILTKLYPKFLP